MQDKQKVTLYLPPQLHRQLKIKAAVDIESMSSIVERAIAFYLQNPEVVDTVETSHGKTHQVYVCPECDSSLLEREGEMISLKSQPGVLAEEVPIETVRDSLPSVPNDKENSDLFLVSR